MERTQLKDELLDRIYASPGDLDLRAVYSDYLIAMGDPRGEFISLQLRDQPTKQQARRVRELLKRHSHEWLGELDPVIGRKHLVFRGGFPAVGAVVSEKHQELIALAAHRGWTTFTELDLGEVNMRQVNEAFFESESVRVNLTALRNVAVQNLAVIGRTKGDWTLRRISTGHFDWAAAGQDVLEGLGDSRSFEALSEFEIRWIYASPERLLWLVHSPLWLKPSRMTISMPMSVVAEWAAEAARFATVPNRQIKLKSGLYDIRFVACDGGYDLFAENPRPERNQPLQMWTLSLRHVLDSLEQTPHELVITADRDWPPELISELRLMSTSLVFVGEPRH